MMNDMMPTIEETATPDILAQIEHEEWQRVLLASRAVAEGGEREARLAQVVVEGQPVVVEDGEQKVVAAHAAEREDGSEARLAWLPASRAESAKHAISAPRAAAAGRRRPRRAVADPGRRGAALVDVAPRRGSRLVLFSRYYLCVYLLSTRGSSTRRRRATSHRSRTSQLRSRGAAAGRRAPPAAPTS